jgi:hypothetical protein
MTQPASPIKFRTFASDRHYQLANAITEMAFRYAQSMHRAGLAFMGVGSHGGRTWQQLERRANWQCRALGRLTYALRDLDTKEA